jgi:hypothetical protein
MNQVQTKRPPSRSTRSIRAARLGAAGLIDGQPLPLIDLRLRNCRHRKIRRSDPRGGIAQSDEASDQEIANELGMSLEECFSMLTVKLGLRRDELSLMDIGRRAGAAPASQPEIAAAG